MIDGSKTTKYLSEHEWLVESQALITNLKGWISTGHSETAMREIDDYWRRWRWACKQATARF